MQHGDSYNMHDIVLRQINVYTEQKVTMSEITYKMC